MTSGEPVDLGRQREEKRMFWCGRVRPGGEAAVSRAAGLGKRAVVVITVAYIQEIDQISKYVKDSGGQFPLVLEKGLTHMERGKTRMTTMVLTGIGSTG